MSHWTSGLPHKKSGLCEKCCAGLRRLLLSSQPLSVSVLLPWVVEIEKSSKEKTETENLSITNKTDNKMEQSKDTISLEATSLNENVSIAKAENIIKTRSESEDDDKLFINEDDSDSINEKSQNEITINQTKEKTHDEVSFLKEPRLEATPTENETKEKIENSSHLDSASINSVELPLDLTVNKK